MSNPEILVPNQEIVSATNEQLPVKPKRPKKKRTRGQKIRLAILLTVVAVIVGGAVYGIFQLFKEEEVITPTSMVYRGVLETIIQGSGNAMPKEKEDVITLASGTVTDVFVENGQQVTAGDPLFKIDTEVIDEKLDEAYAAQDRIAEDLKTAVKRINNLTVTAPFSGKTMGVEIKKGDQLGENSTVATMVDDSKMKLKLYFSYAYIDAIKKGMEAAVSIPQSMASVPGRVHAIEPIKKITPEGAILFEAEIIMDNPGTLTKGMAASAVLLSPGGEIMPADGGSLEYNEELKVYAKSPGEVIELMCRDYYEFSAGDVLCVLENDSLGTEINRIQKEYDSAQEKINELLKEREGYEAVAKISGTVLSCNLAVGDELSGSGGAVAVSIANLTNMVVNIQIDELDIGKVKSGMQAEITMEDMDGTQNFFGTVTSVSLTGKAENGVSFYPGQITIEGAQNLMADRYVNYRIVAERVEDCLLIPSAAALYTEHGMVAFVKDDGRVFENTIELDPVSVPVPKGFVALLIETGRSNTREIEVVSGLEEGMEVAGTDMGEDNGMYYGGRGGMIMKG